MKPAVVQPWTTPFSTARSPSAYLILEPAGERTATLVVAPGGLDSYPKYLVHFQDVLAISCEEEIGALEARWGINSTPISCAFILEASPAVESYNSTPVGMRVDLQHFLVLGGDNHVSVVARKSPMIEEVCSPQQLIVQHEI
jgi:hypothetical protein